MRTHWGALVVGAVFFVLTLFYSVAVPLWEADNEWSHYQYIRYIATQRSLPAPDTQIALPGSGDLCRDLAEDGMTTVHQFRQPPLYYLLGVLAVAGMDLETDLAVIDNPHVFAPFSEGGRNVVVHTAAERFPYEGTALAVHRVRALSGLIGLAGLVATYLSGLLLFPQRRHLALAMMAVNAFIPQVVFSASVINNDILVGALGWWCVYLCLFYLLRRPSPWVLALAVLITGLAILTKYSGLVLVPVLAITVFISLLRSWRQDRLRFRRELWQVALVVGLASAPVALWLARNWILYGEVFPAYERLINSLLFPEALLRDGGAGQERLRDPFYTAQFALMTFWGLFGNDNIALPSLVVLLLEGVFLASLFGVALVMLDRRQPSTLRVAALVALLVVAEAWLVNFVKAAGTSEPRGRYFLPVYSTVSFLLVLGIDRLLPARWRLRGAALLPGFLLALTLAVPPLLLRPSYAPPPVETATALRPGEEPLNAVFGGFAELLGYRIEPERIGVYENVEVTLVWRALQPTSNNYTVGVHLLDGANVSHDQVARFPGGGNFATSLWQPGDVFRDVYQVGLGPDSRDSLPSLGRIKVAMYCYQGQEDRHLGVTDAQGNSLGDAVYLGRIKLAAGSPEQQPDAPVLFDFGDQIVLEQFTLAPQTFPLGAEMVLDFQWRSVGAPASDYTLFVHLVDSQGNTAAASDQPLTGNYYPSGLWEPGERITHVHRLPLPAVLSGGLYTLRIGLYDAATGQRLPVTDAGGQLQADGIAELASIPGDGYYLFIPIVLHDTEATLSQ